MGVSARYNGRPQDLLDRIVLMERRLNALENGPQAAFTSIDQEGLTINDGGSIVINDNNGICFNFEKLAHGQTWATREALDRPTQIAARSTRIAVAK